MGLKPAAGGGWLRGALALSALILALLVLDVFRWHPGYSLGDESDVVGFLQRVREGMPWRWVLTNGSLHKSLLYLAMQAWPGSLWVTSLPGILALPLEAALLFALGSRLAGPRAGFFAVLAGLCASFTLVRARLGLSLSIFPLEWLALLWSRSRCRRPWAWVVWGAALGICLFDYEAWAPGVVLFMVLPFLEPVPLRQRAWELLGVASLLLLLLPWQQVIEGYERRRAGSLFLKGSSPASASAGWKGFIGLFWGGKTMPYMAPPGHGVIPLWYVLALPLGLKHWGRRAWLPLVYLAAGAALVLAGGAPYGLPAHRFIAAWPALALLTGLGLDRAFDLLPSARQRRLLAVAVALACGQQLFNWASSEAQMDGAFHGPNRNLKAAAQAAWEQSKRTGLPLVTELHPLKAPEFRFMVGHPVPWLPAHPDSVVAFLPWEYLPALRGEKVTVATFQEEGGVAPGYVGLLHGSQAKAAMETELAMRPLMQRSQLFSLKSRALMGDWLLRNPEAGDWARTYALDYVSYVDWHSAHYDFKDIEALHKERLVSARPLIMAAMSTSESLPEFSLDTLRWGLRVDPFNGSLWTLEDAQLRRMSRTAEADERRRRFDEQNAKGLLLWD